MGPFHRCCLDTLRINAFSSSAGLMCSRSVVRERPVLALPLIFFAVFTRAVSHSLRNSDARTSVNKDEESL